MSSADNEKCKISIFATSTEIVSKTDVYLFPVTALVAEFGGTLGLFLGVSFMTLWDGLEVAWWTVRKLAKDTKKDKKNRWIV